MKSLTNIIKKSTRNLAFGGAVALGLAFGAGKIGAQTQTKNYQNFLNPYVAEFFDVKNTRDYYGSGDANGDGYLTFADATAMQTGTINYRTDVDGDGNFSTVNDQNIVKEVLNGQRKGVPFDWNRTENVAQRRWIIQKYLDLDNTWVYDASKASWDCDQYAWESLFKTNGVEKATASPWWTDVSAQVGNKLERWKIPTYLHYSDTYAGVKHTSIAVFIGSDDPTKDTPLEYENWLVYNSTTGEFDMKPGHPLIKKDGKIWISKKMYLLSQITQEFTYDESDLIKFNLSNGVDEVTYKRTGLVTTRPTNPVSGIENIVNPFGEPTLSVFPNPVLNGYDLNVVNSNGQFDEDGKLVIYDITGRKVYEQNSLIGVDNKIIVPSDKINSFANGMYIINYISPKEKASVKIQKQIPD